MEKLPGEPGTKSFAVAQAIVTGAFGVALGPAGAMVSAGFFGTWNAVTMRTWAQHVDARLAEKDKELDPNDPQTKAVFNKLTFAALQTSRHDKWDLLVDALANSGSASPNPDFIQELFADYVIKYTPQHVHLLYLAASPREWLKTHGNGASEKAELREVLQAQVFAGSDDHELMSETLWNELHTDGMMLNRPGWSRHNRRSLHERLDGYGEREALPAPSRPKGLAPISLEPAPGNGTADTVLSTATSLT